MKIQIIPETMEEKKKFLEKGTEQINYTNVQEYFFFGNRVDEEGSVLDIHEWHGGYRYLLGSLQYFYEVVNDMRKESVTPPSNVQRAKVDLKLMPPPQPMVKRGKVKDSNIQVLDQDNGLQLLDRDDVDKDDGNQNITQIRPDLPNFKTDEEEQEENVLKKSDMPNPENIRKALDKIKIDLGENVETKEEKE